MKTMAFGMLASALLLASVCCLYYKKPRLGLVSSTAAVILIGLTGYSWWEMLIDSGKDTALLGFSRYPAAPIMLALLFLAAFAVTIVHTIRAASRNERNKRG